MTIPSDVRAWLQGAGYKHHCFISWPHTVSKDITTCAETVKSLIEQKLAMSNPSPSIFIDKHGIPGGAEWRESLRSELCKSIMMIAICAPIYYDASHKWCGLEWAAMDLLSQRRLSGEGMRPIIPIIVRLREDEPLPEAVSQLQYFDFSKIMTIGTGYYRSRECKQVISDIVNHIEDIACLLAEKQAQTDCANFQIPSVSAFVGYQVRRQPAPFRSQ